VTLLKKKRKGRLGSEGRRSKKQPKSRLCQKGGEIFRSQRLLSSESTTTGVRKRKDQRGSLLDKSQKKRKRFKKSHYSRSSTCSSKKNITGGGKESLRGEEIKKNNRGLLRSSRTGQICVLLATFFLALFRGRISHRKKAKRETLGGTCAGDQGATYEGGMHHELAASSTFPTQKKHGEKHAAKPTE